MNFFEEIRELSLSATEITQNLMHRKKKTLVIDNGDECFLNGRCLLRKVKLEFEVSNIMVMKSTK